mgnify:CR=1 FL=1
MKSVLGEKAITDTFSPMYRLLTISALLTLTLSCSKPEAGPPALELTIDASQSTPCTQSRTCLESCNQNADGQACFEMAMQSAQSSGALYDPAARAKLNEGRDFPRALELLKGECADNNLISCYLAGQLCYMGLGGYLDQLCALSSFEKSCLGGVIQSCTQLGKIYKEGRFVAEDQQVSKRYLTAACNAGDSAACQALKP